MASSTSGGIIPRPRPGLFPESEPHRVTRLRHQAWDLWVEALKSHDDAEGLRLYNLSVAFWADANELMAYCGVPMASRDPGSQPPQASPPPEIAPPPISTPVQHQQASPQQAPVEPYSKPVDAASRKDHICALWASGRTDFPKNYQPSFGWNSLGVPSGAVRLNYRYFQDWCTALQHLPWFNEMIGPFLKLSTQSVDNEGPHYHLAWPDVTKTSGMNYPSMEVLRGGAEHITKFLEHWHEAPNYKRSDGTCDMWIMWVKKHRVASKFKAALPNAASR